MKKILILCSVFLTGCFLQSDIKMIQTINLWEEKNCVIELFDWRYVKQLNDTDIIVRTEYNMFWIIEGMGSNFADDRRYTASKGYCFRDTGRINQNNHYPIAKHVKIEE